MKTLLTHARLVLPDQVVEDGSLLVEDETIAGVCLERAPGGVDEIDLEGAWLVPGLVDLHCDALEKEIEPRPNVHLPLDFAIANADKRNAAAGITTPYHALSFAHGDLGLRNVDVAAQIAGALRSFRPTGLVDGRLHCRYEVADPSGYPVLAGLLEEGGVDLLSFMDHTPGQGQFKDLGAYRDYLVRTYATPPAEAERLAAQKLEQRAGAGERIAGLAAVARAAGVRLASHDDDSAARVAAMCEVGVSISEFPINLPTARAARASGLATVFGAPNVLRGKSQSGSMRALEAVEHGVADCLCSDYVPSTLLAAAFALPGASSLSLPGAVRLVTLHPARAAGLADRGALEPGLRADLVAVRPVGDHPQVTHTWVEGRLVHRSSYRG